MERSFGAVYSFSIGGRRVHFGVMAQDGTNGPVLYVAAFTADGLHGPEVGFGTREAEAAADLMRVERDAQLNESTRYRHTD